MKKLQLLLSLALLSAACLLHAEPVALFYLTSGPDSIRSFLAHSRQIDLLVPTWYQVDENGLVTGAPDATVLKRAGEDKVPVMPILAMFNKKGFHVLASNANAQSIMNQAMIRECKLHGYTGFQFDFENVDWTDRDLLTAVVKVSADALHKAGLQLTIATVPNAPGFPGAGGFAKWIYTDWRGAYDIEALAKSVDLLCLMNLRPEHALDDAGSCCRLGLDGRESQLRAQDSTQGKAFARHSRVWIPLVCGRADTGCGDGRG